MKAGKQWGWTETILDTPMVRMERIFVRAGGFCSQHRHRFKSNVFHVFSGRMAVRTWKEDYKLVDETIIGPGETCKSVPGEFHEFRALEDCEAIETYYLEPLSDGDIERRTVGGVVEA